MMAIFITIAAWCAISLAIMLISPVQLAARRVLYLCDSFLTSDSKGAVFMGHLIFVLITVVMFPLYAAKWFEGLIDKALDKRLRKKD